MKKLIKFKIIFMLVLFIFIQTALAANVEYSTQALTVTITDKYEINNSSSDIVVSGVEDISSQNSTRYIIADHMRYEILPSTTMSYQGKTITADQLSIPCKAQISFQILKNGTRNLLDLKMFEKRSGTSRAWSELPPE